MRLLISASVSMLDELVERINVERERIKLNELFRGLSTTSGHTSSDKVRLDFVYNNRRVGPSE